MVFGCGWLVFKFCASLSGSDIDLAGGDLGSTWISYFIAAGAIAGIFLNKPGWLKEQVMYSITVLIIAIAALEIAILVRARLQLWPNLIITLAMLFVGYFFALALQTAMKSNSRHK